jgi:hypothetical protein
VRQWWVACGLGLGVLLALGGCVLTPPAPNPNELVSVAEVINSVKCGLAQAMQSEAGRRRLPGTIANVELGLKIVDSRSLGASTPSSIGPVIFAWFGPTILPAVAGSNTQSFTVDTTINLTYRLDAPNVTLCSAAGVDAGDRLGFARWLADVIAGLSKVSLEGPKGSLDRLTYDATFAVTRDGSFGGSVKVVFLTASATAAANRADTQRLRIVISGPNAVATSLDGNTVLTKSPGPIQSLSRSRPSP